MRYVHCQCAGFLQEVTAQHPDGRLGRRGEQELGDEDGVDGEEAARDDGGAARANVDAAAADLVVVPVSAPSSSRAIRAG